MRLRSTAIVLFVGLIVGCADGGQPVPATATPTVAAPTPASGTSTAAASPAAPTATAQRPVQPTNAPAATSRGVAIVTKKDRLLRGGAPFLSVEFEIDGKPAEGGEPGYALPASTVQTCWDAITVGGPVPACWPFGPGKLGVGDGPGR